MILIASRKLTMMAWLTTSRVVSEGRVCVKSGGVLVGVTTATVATPAAGTRT